MELPRGITGFRYFNDPPLPQSDLTLFRTHCFTSARSCGGTLCRCDANEVRVGGNFEMQVFDLSCGQVAALLNAHYPILAFANASHRNDAPFEFVDHPDLAMQFSTFNAYQILSAASLNEPVEEDSCRQLTVPEHDQIKYWRPDRVGDLLFNKWD